MPNKAKLIYHVYLLIHWVPKHRPAILTAEKQEPLVKFE